MPAEDVVLLAAGAVGALQATDEEDCHTQSYEDGENTRIRRNPVK